SCRFPALRAPPAHPSFPTRRSSDLAPALDAVVLQWQVAGGFIGQDRSHFLSQFAKVLGADIGSAHQAEFVSDQRVADLSNGHGRSEEHTSELQSRENLVCRLLLEKK